MTRDKKLLELHKLLYNSLSDIVVGVKRQKCFLLVVNYRTNVAMEIMKMWAATKKGCVRHAGWWGTWQKYDITLSSNISIRTKTPKEIQRAVKWKWIRNSKFCSFISSISEFTNLKSKNFRKPGCDASPHQSLRCPLSSSLSDKKLRRKLYQLKCCTIQVQVLPLFRIAAYLINLLVSGCPGLTGAGKDSPRDVEVIALCPYQCFVFPAPCSIVWTRSGPRDQRGKVPVTSCLGICWAPLLQSNPTQSRIWRDQPLLSSKSWYNNLFILFSCPLITDGANVAQNSVCFLIIK